MRLTENQAGVYRELVDLWGEQEALLIMREQALADWPTWWRNWNEATPLLDLFAGILTMAQLALLISNAELLDPLLKQAFTFLEPKP